MIQLSAIATAVFGQWHPAGDLALPRIGMPAFDALAASVLRGQRAGGARAIDDRLTAIPYRPATPTNN